LTDEAQCRGNPKQMMDGSSWWRIHDHNTCRSRAATAPTVLHKS